MHKNDKIHGTVEKISFDWTETIRLTLNVSKEADILFWAVRGDVCPFGDRDGLKSQPGVEREFEYLKEKKVCKGLKNRVLIIALCLEPSQICRKSFTPPRRA